jgi:2'-5' RNA ligase
METEQIRTFIAIELPGVVKQALAQVQEKLKFTGDEPVNWVDPQNVHLTLKFLGNVDVNNTGKIAAAMETASNGIPTFDIQIGGIGAFPNLKRVQIVWMGLSGDLVKLDQLHMRIEANLIPLGFTAETRPFTPHLTIARLRNYASPEIRQKLGELITATPFEEQYTINVNTVYLVRSQLTPQGPIYSRIGSVRLK